MKVFIGLLSLLVITRTVVAQYYYKDIILTKQISERCKIYKENAVKAVRLSSFEGTGEPTEGFVCEQTVTNNFSEISTYTHSNSSSASSLTTFYDTKGLLKKTIDTSDTYQSTTDYAYDSTGHIISITNTSLETDNQVKDEEQHIWKYNQNGKPSGMLKIKNGTDTTYIQFLEDEKGNVSEERAMRHKTNLPAIYYYYNNENRLTDIVRYNAKAQRLLPDYIFEYDNKGRIVSMLFVPAGSSDYQKWIYEYNERGLKWKESCFNKRKILLGRIEYQYSFQ